MFVAASLYEREGRRLEKLSYKKHIQGTWDYKERTKCTADVWAQRVFLVVLREPVERPLLPSPTAQL